MTTRFLKTDLDRKQYIKAIEAQALPLTVSHAKGIQRTNQQNKTFSMWYGEAALQLGDTDQPTVRAECKLMFGVPILRRDDAAFMLTYDASFKPLNFETKVLLFKALEPAVTSKMTTKQCAEYMDAMQRHFLPMGIRLTDPELQKYESEVA
jgi:hypothetical protein